ncbi:MAG: hypothetical protein ACYS67_02405 [Planctomycetota bacterium]|jgi:hypothetical protein
MKTKIITFGVATLLAGICPVSASMIFLDSGHYVWTDADPYYDEVFLENDASLDFLSGSIGQLSTRDESLTTIEGGQMHSLWTFGNSIVQYHAGKLDYISASHNSIVFLYAYDVIYDPIGGMNNEGYVEGSFYRNDEAFSFSCWNTPTWSHIEIVPESATFILITCGLILLRKRN